MAGDVTGACTSPATAISLRELCGALLVESLRQFGLLCVQRLLKPSRGFQIGCGVCDDVIQLGQFRLQGPDFHLCPALALVIIHRLEAQIAGVLVVSTLGIDALLAGRAQADLQGVEDLDGGDQTFPFDLPRL